MDSYPVESKPLHVPPMEEAARGKRGNASVERVSCSEQCPPYEQLADFVWGGGGGGQNFVPDRYPKITLEDTFLGRKSSLIPFIVHSEPFA